MQKTYAASENLDALIVKAREDMERAAKSLDFLAAAKFRDRMYELQKLREETGNGSSRKQHGTNAVKITILKTTIHEDLARQYAAPGFLRSDRAVGDLYTAGDRQTSAWWKVKYGGQIAVDHQTKVASICDGVAHNPQNSRKISTRHIHDHRAAGIDSAGNGTTGVPVGSGE